MLITIDLPDVPSQKSVIEAVLEMAEREAKEINQLKAQALNPQKSI